jgi:hypothetical protein
MNWGTIQTSRKVQNKHPRTSYTGCFQCGRLDHRVRNCPFRQINSTQTYYENANTNQQQTANVTYYPYNSPVGDPTSVPPVFARAASTENAHKRIPTYLRGTKGCFIRCVATA